MRRLILLFSSIILLSTLGILSGCNGAKSVKESETIVSIETEFGILKLKLYDETPLHRDNFIKLAESGIYDGVKFHRVINNFMIQGGDPSTKKDSCGATDDNYTLEAEFRSNLFHKKGVLAAARLGDNENPEKRSSGYQFYIVQGKKFSLDELNALSSKKNDLLKKSITNRLVMEKADQLMDKGFNPNFTEIYVDLQDTIELVYNLSTKYTFSEEQIQAYATIGGTPHLDGDYTVFGEVTEGFEIIDNIAQVKTNPADCPLQDIRMKIKVLKR